MNERSEAREPAPDDDRESAYELFQRGHALLRQRHFAPMANWRL